MFAMAGGRDLVFSSMVVHAPLLVVASYARSGLHARPLRATGGAAHLDPSIVNKNSRGGNIWGRRIPR